MLAGFEKQMRSAEQVAITPLFDVHRALPAPSSILQFNKQKNAYIFSQSI